MVAGGLKRTGNFGKHPSTVMHNHGSFPVHQLLCPRDAAAIRLGNTLVAEANTEDGDGGTIFANQIHTNTGLIRRARSGRNYDVGRRQDFDIVERDLIITIDRNPLTQFAQILYKVVCE